MALDGNVAGTKIYNMIEALTDTQKENTELVWQKIMIEIYNDIKTNGDILPGTFTAGGDSVIGSTKMT